MSPTPRHVGDLDTMSAIEAVHGADAADLTVRNSRHMVKESKDVTLLQFKHWYDHGRLTLDSEWQRGYVWSDERASKFIESMLLQIPTPVVYLAKAQDGSYEVIDGVQRLMTVFRFMDDAFALSGLALLTDLNGRRFSELPEVIRYRIEDAMLATLILSGAVKRDLFFIMFERLNTGRITLDE